MAASYLKPPSFFVGDSASFLHDATIMSWTMSFQRAHKAAKLRSFTDTFFATAFSVASLAGLAERTEILRSSRIACSNFCNVF
jgi:hypothetical protein